MIGPVGVWLTSDSTWPVAAGPWVLRNAVSTLVVVAVGLRLLEHPPASSVAWRMGRTWELPAFALVALAIYGCVFGWNVGLPLAYLVLPLSVWVALRGGTTLAALHTLLAGSVLIASTLHGRGPFALQDPVMRVLLAQGFIAVASFVGLLIAITRDERLALLARLREAKDEATEQAALLDTVIDSISDGVVAVDATGSSLVYNSAARRMLGVPGHRGTPAGWSEHYGVSHADGSPYPSSALPLVRALGGEPSPRADMVVRNAANPEGRTIDVSARPLPGAGVQHGAVAVFRDVTVERDRQATLAAFAGVVAHDLLNPLTAVEGWLEVVDEAVADGAAGPAGANARLGIDGIRRACARMRALITDLLAYTTARDQALRLADVPLEAAVRDSLAGRWDDSARDLAPHVTISGELPTVRADPALLRQLLDNLVGNAIKYARSGERATIDVSAQALEEPGWAQITIADRGLGIPPGQHEAVFEEFHRAHPGSDRGGTGLGLAICRRIVNRHGGRIDASPNDGGGTRLTFTLPTTRAKADGPVAGVREALGAVT